MLIVQRRPFLSSVRHGEDGSVETPAVNQPARRVGPDARVATMSIAMTVLDRLERRFGYLAVPGLLRYVAAFSALAFVLYKLDASYLALIDLDRQAILHGQLWRLVTYIFVPALGSVLPMPDWANAAFYVLFLIWIGNGLEQEWGAFKVTAFFVLGMIGTTVAAIIFGATYSNAMLISSLFFAFARLFPDTIIYVAFLIPVKVRWLAWIYAVILLIGFVAGSLSYRMALVAALANYFIFFGREIFYQARHRKELSARRKRFDLDSRNEAEPLHRCATCGATELSDPALEFRVSRDGEEYCTPHLPAQAAGAIVA